jgi:acyl-CoA synthetase (AMP-forming)/AMP-acid ligase II
MTPSKMHPCFHARVQPDKPAYIMAGSGELLTYRELDERSNRGAQLFRSLGLEAGEHIALLLENSLRFLEVCWAAQRCGLYYTAISTYLTAEEIDYIVRDCGARVFIASPKLFETAAQVGPPTLKRYIFGEARDAFASWDAAVRSQPSTPISDEVVGYDMLYSSGTTGRPKGVKPPFKNDPLGTVSPLQRILIQDMCRMGRDTVYLSPAPLYHAAPLRFNITVAAFGGTSVVMERFDAEDYLRCVEKYRATHTQLVPTMFVRMLKLPEETRRAYDVSSLEVAVHAAAPCPVPIKEQMIEWWGPILLEYYGGTEANGLTVLDSRQWLEHRGSVGRAIVAELKILDDEGEEVSTGEIGGVYFANGPPFSYHNDAEKTRRAYNDKGWSTLGDVGYLDADGYLYLTDRKAYMIISGGVNIYPQEAENLLVTHRAVADVAVFGVPNEEMGEEVKAVVQPVERGAGGKALEAELTAFCRAHLSPLKCPRSIDFDDDLPRTATGKLLKRLIRDRYWK